MEELLKSLGIEEAAVNAMDARLASLGITENPIRLQWKKGMRFTLTSIDKGQVLDANRQPVSDPFPLFFCSNGGSISPKHFQDVKGEVVPFELSRKGMIRYFLAHQAGNTEFRIKDYTPSEGTFGTSEYVPTSFKIEIVSTDIEEGEE